VPFTSAVATPEGSGYWVVTAQGSVYNFRDAPDDGDMAGAQLNGAIIAPFGS